MRRLWWHTLALAVMAGAWFGARSPAVPAGAFQLTRIDQVVSAVPVHDRLIALTFDDGPSPVFTPEILDLLDRYNARATFFVTGFQAARYPELLRRMASAGHLVGSHGYSHRDLRGHPLELIYSELDRTAETVRRITGREPTLFRAPYGHLDDPLITAAVTRGYRVIHWTCDGRDGYTRTTADEIYQRIRACPPGGIILLHDRGGDRTATVRSTARLLADKTAKGYRFVTVEELLQASDPRPARSRKAGN